MIPLQTVFLCDFPLVGLASSPSGTKMLRVRSSLATHCMDLSTIGVCTVVSGQSSVIDSAVAEVLTILIASLLHRVDRMT